MTELAFLIVGFVLVWGCFGMLCTEPDLALQKRWLVAEIVVAVLWLGAITWRIFG